MTIPPFVVLGALLIAIGCGTDPGLESGGARQEQPLASTEVHTVDACPDPSVVLSGWMRTQAQFHRFSLLLPSRAELQDIIPAAGGIGETWRADGLTVFYRIRRESPEVFEPSSVMEDVLVCRDVLGGKHADLISYYSEATTIPGRFVFGTFQLEEDSILTIHARSPNRAARDSLLAILRSVRFD